MPDFERILRKLSIHVAKTPRKRALLKAKYIGEDSARYELLRVGLYILVIVLGLCGGIYILTL